MRDADIFIGVSAPNIVSEEMIRSMAAGAVVFPMANPVPEISPELEEYAKASGKPFLPYPGDEDYIDAYNDFYASL